MNVAKLILKLNIVIMSLLLLAGCPPYSTTAKDPTLSQQQSVEGQLSKTSTGQLALDYLNHLKNLGYKIEISYKSESEITSLGGHNGGSYDIKDMTIKININKDFNSSEQAHVIAHELQHVQDEFETNSFLKDYPHVEKSAQDIVNRLNEGKDLADVDAKEVSFVSATLFCTEVRAYSVNQRLTAEGLKTDYFYHSNGELGSFIDQKYISVLGQSYGADSGAMLQWCRSFDKISDVEKQLVW